MVYGKIVNGEVVLAPVKLVLDDGRTIFNFNKNVELIKCFANGNNDVLKFRCKVSKKCSKKCR